MLESKILFNYCAANKIYLWTMLRPINYHLKIPSLQRRDQNEGKNKFNSAMVA